MINLSFFFTCELSNKVSYINQIFKILYKTAIFYIHIIYKLFTIFKPGLFKTEGQLMPMKNRIITILVSVGALSIRIRLYGIFDFTIYRPRSWGGRARLGGGASQSSKGSGYGRDGC